MMRILVEIPAMRHHPLFLEIAVRRLPDFAAGLSL